MSSGAYPLPAAVARVGAARVALGLLGLMAVAVVLRADVLGAGYWTDESISVGIAGRPLLEIPGALRLDGSPPLYYLLLHGWMALWGTAEAATRSLSLVAAVLAVPVAFLAGRAAGGDRRTGWIAAGAVATLPFLTLYAQETRMYALVVTLSLAATGCFAAVLRTGRAAPHAGLAVCAVALLYTHNWAVFLLLALAGAWLWEWRAGRVRGRPGVLVAAVVALLWLPWLPSLLFQARHTGAPWATVPGPVGLLAGPVVLAGAVGAAVLGVAVAAALVRERRTPGPRTLAAPLLLAGLGAGALAWAFNQVEPAWASRYLAVCAGPLVLGAAVGLRRAPWLPVVVALVGVAWVAWTPPAERSNVRALATALGPELHRGDAVIATGPQHVPVLAAYLPDGLRWFTSAGPPADTATVDWRDLVQRVGATPPAAVADAAVAGLPRDGRIVLVAPFERRGSAAPLRALVRARTAQITERLDRDPRLERLPSEATDVAGTRSALRAAVWRRALPQHLSR